MKRESKAAIMLEIARGQRLMREAGAVPLNPGHVRTDYRIRPKRRDGEVWRKLPRKFFVNVSYETSADVIARAWRNGLCRAEFMLVILLAALRRESFITEALAEYRAMQEDEGSIFHEPDRVAVPPARVVADDGLSGKSKGRKKLRDKPSSRRCERFSAKKAPSSARQAGIPPAEGDLKRTRAISLKRIGGGR